MLFLFLCWTLACVDVVVDEFKNISVNELRQERRLYYLEPARQPRLFLPYRNGTVITPLGHVRLSGFPCIDVIVRAYRDISMGVGLTGASNGEPTAYLGDLLPYSRGRNRYVLNLTDTDNLDAVKGIAIHFENDFPMHNLVWIERVTLKCTFPRDFEEEQLEEIRRLSELDTVKTPDNRDRPNKHFTSPVTSARLSETGALEEADPVKTTQFSRTNTLSLESVPNVYFDNAQEIPSYPSVLKNRYSSNGMWSFGKTSNLAGSDSNDMVHTPKFGRREERYDYFTSLLVAMFLPSNHYEYLLVDIVNPFTRLLESIVSSLKHSTEISPVDLSLCVSALRADPSDVIDHDETPEDTYKLLLKVGRGSRVMVKEEMLPMGANSEPKVHLEDMITLTAKEGVSFGDMFRSFEFEEFDMYEFGTSRFAPRKRMASVKSILPYLALPGSPPEFPLSHVKSYRSRTAPIVPIYFDRSQSDYEFKVPIDFDSDRRSFKLLSGVFRDSEDGEFYAIIKTNRSGTVRWKQVINGVHPVDLQEDVLKTVMIKAHLLFYSVSPLK